MAERGAFLYAGGPKSAGHPDQTQMLGNPVSPNPTKTMVFVHAPLAQVHKLRVTQTHVRRLAWQKPNKFQTKNKPLKKSNQKPNKSEAKTEPVETNFEQNRTNFPTAQGVETKTEQISYKNRVVETNFDCNPSC